MTIVNKIAAALMGILITAGILASACSVSPTIPADQGNRLDLMATTTFVGEVVERVAGDAAQVTVLLQPGQNPHAYQPSPQDMVRISGADIVFSNGFGLEEFLGELLDAADFSGMAVEVSQGIDPLRFTADQVAEADLDETVGGIDPHVWFDPNNLMVWAENIASVLADADPENAQLYRDNAARYRSQLEELDGWIRDQVKTIPSRNRELVTDHSSFGYFAEEYGFQQIGAVVPAATTEAETSGKQLAGLLETIRTHDVKAVFVSVDIDPKMAEIVSRDAGVPLVPLYFGSLTSGGPADTYQDFMRFDVEAIVAALR